MDGRDFTARFAVRGGFVALASLAGCSRGAAGGGSGKGLAGNGDDDPSDLSDVTITIEPPAPASEVIMVENACRLAEGEPTAEDTLLRALEYSEPAFSLADRLPDGMTRGDVYYFDLMGMGAGTVKNSQMPCDVAEDTTLPEGFTYLVVDVSIRNPLDEKVNFNTAGCMLGVYSANDDPALTFEGIDANTYPRTDFDQVGYAGEGAFSIFTGADNPLWVSGYDGPVPCSRETPQVISGAICGSFRRSAISSTTWCRTRTCSAGALPGLSALVRISMARIRTPIRLSSRRQRQTEAGCAEQ